MPPAAALRLGAGHRVGVVARAAEEGLGDPAVPDPAGLVAEVIEAVREDGIDQVRFRVEQQRDALRVLGVEGEVPRLRPPRPRWRPAGKEFLPSRSSPSSVAPVVATGSRMGEDANADALAEPQLAVSLFQVDHALQSEAGVDAGRQCAELTARQEPVRNFGDPCPWPASRRSPRPPPARPALRARCPANSCETSARTIHAARRREPDGRPGGRRAHQVPFLGLHAQHQAVRRRLEQIFLAFLTRLLQLSLAAIQLELGQLHLQLRVHRLEFGEPVLLRLSPGPWPRSVQRCATSASTWLSSVLLDQLLLVGPGRARPRRTLLLAASRAASAWARLAWYCLTSVFGLGQLQLRGLDGEGGLLLLQLGQAVVELHERRILANGLLLLEQAPG